MEVELQEVQGSSGKDALYLLHQNDTWEIEEDFTTIYPCHVETYLQSISHNEVIKMEDMETGEPNENANLLVANGIDVNERSSDLLNLLPDRISIDENNINKNRVNTLFCCQCKKSFKFESNLNLRGFSGSALQFLSCTNCVIKFQQKYQLNQCFLMNSNLNLTTTIDVQRFSEGHKLKEGKSIQYLSSNKCDESPSYKSQLKKRKLKKSYFEENFSCDSHKLNPFTCDECKKTFPHRTSLVQHQKYAHGKMRPFPCDQCEQAFVYKSHLNQHKLTHSGLRHFSCDKCKKAFRSKGHLNEHKMTHIDVKTFVCHNCDKSFKRRLCLKQHEKHCQ